MTRVLVVKSSRSFKARIEADLPVPTNIDSEAVKLVRVPYENQVDYCQSCGREGGTKFNTGNAIVCTECFAGDNIARQFGGEIVQEGMSIRKFKERIKELVSLEVLNQLPQIREWVR